MKYDELRKELATKAARQGIGLVGEFELTPHCNLNCYMCYTRKQNQNLKDADEWLDLIRDAYQEGLLFALFTGGEVFSHPQFKKIYETAYDLGIRIVIYTNGTLINKEIVDILKARKPEYVGITLYGASDETYQKVTGNNKGFTQVLKAIKLLQENDINIKLRTIAIPEIYDEIDKILDFIKEKGLNYDYSLYVSDNCRKSRRLSPQQLLEYEKKHLSLFPKRLNHLPYQETGFSCLAGKSGYFVTWDHYLTPCAILDNPKIKITNFKKNWEEFKNLANNIINCHECKSCEYKEFCLECPAHRYLENGFDKCSDYLRSLAKMRYEEKS